MKIQVVVGGMERKEQTSYTAGRASTVTHSVSIRSIDGYGGTFWGTINLAPDVPIPFTLGQELTLSIDPSEPPVPADVPALETISV